MKKDAGYRQRGMTEWKGSRSPGAASPLASWTLGTVQAPPIVAPVWEARTADSAYRQVPRSGSQSGDDCGRCIPALLWAGYSQEDDRRVRDRSWFESEAAEDHQDVRHDDRRSVGARRLAR